MTLDWQNVLAILLVAAAGLFLARATWRSMAAKKVGSGCGACGSGGKCSADSQAEGRQFVPLDGLVNGKPEE